MAEVKSNIYLLNQEITVDTKICRYMDFDVFLQFLSGKLFVPRRRIFIDAREGGKMPLKYKFALRVVGENIQESDNINTVNQNVIDKYIENIRQSGFLLTSCWTFDDGEDYLMWKSYTSRVGVCVKTTVGKLLDSIAYDYNKGEDTEHFFPICSNIYYRNLYHPSDYLESLFTKDEYYASEKEIRIYFVPKRKILDNALMHIERNDNVKQILLDTSLNEEKLSESTNDFSMYKFFKIKPNCIDSIVLSPFIKSSTIECFRDILKNQFSEIIANDNKIKRSDIIVK